MEETKVEEKNLDTLIEELEKLSVNGNATDKVNITYGDLKEFTERMRKSFEDAEYWRIKEIGIGDKSHKSAVNERNFWQAQYSRCHSALNYVYELLKCESKANTATPKAFVDKLKMECMKGL